MLMSHNRTACPTHDRRPLGALRDTCGGAKQTKPSGEWAISALSSSCFGHSKIESTVRYLGIEADDAIEIVVQIDI